MLFSGVARATAARVGVTRASYGAGEAVALAIIADAAHAAGLRSYIDAAGNLAIDNGPSDAPAIWIGSHLDSVPEGGNFDGLAGVVAGLLCLVRARQEGATANLRVVGLRGEESAWFGIPYVGSKALFGALTRADLDRCNPDGVSLQTAMSRASADVTAIYHGEPLIDRAALAAFVELHIEQGPELEDAGEPIAVVSTIRGNLRWDVAAKGVSGHSGTTPMLDRSDAVVGAARFIDGLTEEARRQVSRDTDLAVTVGRLHTDARNDAVSRIADRVSMSLEVRSADAAVLDDWMNEVACQASATERPGGGEIVVGKAVRTDPVELDGAWRSRLLRACPEGTRTMPSGAGHDAAVFQANGVPSAMLFVRNANGSHNPDEAMRIDDFLVGVDALYQAVTGATDQRELFA